MTRPLDYVIAQFADETRAAAALAALREAEAKNELRLVAAVVLVKNAAGEVHLTETGDVKTPHGAAFGALVGGLVGLLGGPVGALLGAAAGAATGGVAATAFDLGFTEAQIAEMRHRLQPGTSAILALIAPEWAERMVVELQAWQAQVTRKDSEQ
jgi:uncharacterized membrane protein